MPGFVVADNQIGVWFYVLVQRRGFLDASHFLEAFSLCFFIAAGSRRRRLKPLSAGFPRQPFSAEVRYTQPRTQPCG